MEWQWIVAILLYVNTVEGLESNDSCQSKEIDSSSSLEKEMNRLQGIHDEYCSKVVLKPGSYTIKTTFVLNNSNISIRGNSSYAPVSITFELGEGIAPLYYLLFRNSNMVEITGIHFENSPGIIGFESVDKVIIRDSTFRQVFAQTQVASPLIIVCTKAFFYFLFFIPGGFHKVQWTSSSLFG